ncbi:MAG: hypothetical protein ABJB66_12360 [Gemmatimonadaceae bacterium]
MTKTSWVAVLPMLLIPTGSFAQTRTPPDSAIVQDTSSTRHRTQTLRLTVSAERLLDFVRYNRIEGLYTGIGLKLSHNDSARVAVGATVGRAWSEHTERGRITVDRLLGAWTVRVRAERSLDITNDFRSPLDSGSLITFGSEDSHDYVDRKSIGVSITRRLVGTGFTLRGELGYADDRYVANSIKRGILLASTDYLPNHGVDAGGYRRTAFVLEWHPEINSKPLLSGLASQLMYERGDGTLTFQRAELHVLARSHLGPFRWLSRGAFGQTFGRDLLPQQLFELGHGQNLPGYENKEFAGARAAILRTSLLYNFNFLNRRMQLTERLRIPGLSPGMSVGLQSGWADASSDAARAAIARLGASFIAAGNSGMDSRPAGNVRSTISAGLRFFSGVAYVGFARAIDRPHPWKFQFAFEPTI